MIADVLQASRTRLSIGGWSDSLIASIAAVTIAQADLSPAAPNSALPLPGVNDLPKQVAEMRLVRFSGRKKPVLANIDGQLSHSCHRRADESKPTGDTIREPPDDAVVMNLSWREQQNITRSADKSRP